MRVSGGSQLVRVDAVKMSVKLDVIAEGVGAEVALDGHQFVNDDGHWFVDDVDATKVLLAV